MKRIIAALALVLTLALPGLAAAEGTGMYLAPKFLMSIQDTGRVERSSALAGTGVDDYSQFTLGGALALGYDFWPQQMLPLRAEIEFAMRGNSEKTWSDGGVNVRDVKGTWNNSTLFANLFWDFHNDSAFTPYIGAVWAWPSITRGMILPPIVATSFPRTTVSPTSPGTWAWARRTALMKISPLTLPTVSSAWATTKSRLMRVAASMRSAAIPTTTNSCWVCVSLSKSG